MATDRDTVQIALNVIGQAGLDSLAKSTENYKHLLEALHGEYARGNIDTEKWLDETAKMTAAMNRQREMLDLLRGTKSSNGQGLLGASYAAQDFISVLSGGGGLGVPLESGYDRHPMADRPETGSQAAIGDGISDD